MGVGSGSSRRKKYVDTLNTNAQPNVVSLKAAASMSKSRPSRSADLPPNVFNPGAMPMNVFQPPVLTPQNSNDQLTSSFSLSSEPTGFQMPGEGGGFQLPGEGGGFQLPSNL